MSGTIVYRFFAESQSFIVKVSGTCLYTFLMIVIGGILGALCVAPLDSTRKGSVPDIVAGKARPH
jgi:hypothetical protein